jgi:hypothetical protein
LFRLVLRKDSSFSEEKEAKRLLVHCRALAGYHPTGNKSFLVLFFKKEHSHLPIGIQRR